MHPKLAFKMLSIKVCCRGFDIRLIASNHSNTHIFEVIMLKTSKLLIEFTFNRN